MNPGEPKFWLRAARRVRFRINLGVFLARVLPIWTLASLAFAAVLLWERQRGGSRAATLSLLFAGALLAHAWIEIRRNRRSRFTLEDALALLDEKLGLHGRLISAHAGVGSFPLAPKTPPAIVRWRAMKAFGPAAFAAGLIALAHMVPIEIEEEKPSTSISEPSSWQEIERALEVLREEPVVSPEAVEDVSSRLADLRAKRREEWFSHGSLEAGDSLREELASDMRELADGVSELTASLEELSRTSDATQPAAARRLRERRLSAAIEDLELGSLPLDRESTRKLHTLARDAKVRRATKEEIEKWKQIRERLYHGLPGGGEQVVVGLVPGSGSEGSSASGVSRGPGSAPVDLSGERTDLGSTRIEAVPGEDASHGLFGSSLGFTSGQHDVDTAGFTSASDGGAIDSKGEGGDLVWTQSLTPGERRVLQKYFK